MGFTRGINNTTSTHIGRPQIVWRALRTGWQSPHAARLSDTQAGGRERGGELDMWPLIPHWMETHFPMQETLGPRSPLARDSQVFLSGCLPASERVGGAADGVAAGF